uniref:RRM domain-containing protein n=1 Tax=Meloidogyne incognita TaxID=6306 RepID=A0A914KRJ9_MELIC
MGRSESKRERDYSPVDGSKRRRRSASRSRSRSNTYSASPSPKREVVSSRRRDDDRRRSRSRDRYSRDYGRDYDRDYGRDRYAGGGGGYRRTHRYADGRDNPEPGPCLGVFGMSLHTSERDLRKLFGEYGEIESVQIVYDRFSGRSRGFGFVYFTSTKDATRAKDHLMDTVIDGMKVRVDYSVTRGGGPYKEKKSEFFSRHNRKSSRSPVRYNSRSRSRS